MSLMFYVFSELRHRIITIGRGIKMGRLKRLPSVIKSPADKKEYRAFKLKNELTVLLVSDLHGADDADEHDEIEDEIGSEEEGVEDEEMDDQNEDEEDDGAPAKKISGRDELIFRQY